MISSLHHRLKDKDQFPFKRAPGCYSPPQPHYPAKTTHKMAATHQFDASKLFDVSGYVCVVTGGGTGIGLMCSQALAANGAKVCYGASKGINRSVLTSLRSTSLAVVQRRSRRQQSPTTLTTAVPSSPSAQPMSPRRTTSRLSSRTSRPRRNISTCSSALLAFPVPRPSPSTTTPVI
jgi:hypothetical protein